MPALGQFVENYISLILPALTFLILALVIWNIILNVRISRMQRRNIEFFAGGKIKNLEELLVNQTQSIKNLDHDIQELFNISNKINNLALRGLFKVGMVRFNPFKDVGGDQSFAIALLNGKNSGLTISSLYTREGTRIYSKAIIETKSEKYPLTEEDKQAIELAVNSKAARPSEDKPE